MTTTIFPLAQWLPGTNQNSTSANDNALRMEAFAGPALGFITALPASPADHDQHLVGSTFGGYTKGNVLIYLGGTWQEFATYDGMVKPVGGVQFVRSSVGPVVTWSATPVWGVVPEIASSPGKPGQMAYDTGAMYVCVAPATWAQATLSAW